MKKNLYALTSKTVTKYYSSILHDFDKGFLRRNFNVLGLLSTSLMCSGENSDWDEGLKISAAAS